MNGLHGRYMRVPANNKQKRQREVLLVYGHHAMLERWWGLVENLTAYGNVTMPDLPGFGGMESFSKIGIRPNLDSYADYLAAFIKLRYKRRRVTIVAISYGFLVVTRMLQRYPELARKVDLLVSVVGFMHKDNLVFHPVVQHLYRVPSRLFATRPVAFLIRHLCFNRPVLKTLYTQLPNSKRRMIEITPEEFDRSMQLEIKLWQANDVRSHWLTTTEFLNLNNCHKKIDLPVAHVVSATDHYINNFSVEQHMRQVFSDYQQFTARSKAHVPSILAGKKEMSVLLPPGLRALLRETAR